MDMVMDRMICYDEATKKHLGSVKNKKVKRSFLYNSNIRNSEKEG